MNTPSGWSLTTPTSIPPDQYRDTYGAEPINAVDPAVMGPDQAAFAVQHYIRPATVFPRATDAHAASSETESS